MATTATTIKEKKKKKQQTTTTRLSSHFIVEEVTTANTGRTNNRHATTTGIQKSETFHVHCDYFESKNSFVEGKRHFKIAAVPNLRENTISRRDFNLAT